MRGEAGGELESKRERERERERRKRDKRGEEEAGGRKRIGCNE